MGYLNLMCSIKKEILHCCNEDDYLIFKTYHHYYQACGICRKKGKDKLWNTNPTILHIFIYILFPFLIVHFHGFIRKFTTWLSDLM